MSNTLNEAFATAKDVLESAEHGASQAKRASKDAIGAAQQGAERAATSVRTTWWDGVKAVSALGSMIRSFTTDDALGWAGLQRRRSPLTSWAIFVFGAAVGSGLGILLAPTAGAATRKRIAVRLWGDSAPVRTADVPAPKPMAASDNTGLPATPPTPESVEPVAAKADVARTNHETPTWPGGPRPL